MLQWEPGENWFPFFMTEIEKHSYVCRQIPDADIISFDDGEIHRCTYEETESYQVTKMFLMHREKMLEGLLGE